MNKDDKVILIGLVLMCALFLFGVIGTVILLVRDLM